MAFDLEAARKAGYTDAEIAQHLAQRWNFDLRKAKSSGYSDGEVIAHLMAKTAPMTSAPIPGQEGEAARVAAARAQPQPTVGNRIVGAAEAAATIGTGATTGVVGGLARGSLALARAVLDGSFGTREAANAIEQAVAGGMQDFTFQPRTEAGRDAVEAVGGVMQNLPPVAGVAGTLAPPTAVLAGPAAAQAATTAAAGARRVGEVAAPVVARVGEAVQRMRAPAEEAAGRAAGGSVGAAGVDLARLRQGLANELPVPIPLMKGQQSRSYADTQEMMVLARDAKVGEPIRERLAQQRQQMVQNMDAFLDETGAQTRDVRSAAEAFDAALRADAAADKRRIRVLYKEAEKAGELERPVTLTGLAEYVNGNKAEASVVDILKGARAKGIELGVFKEGPDGQLQAQPVPIKTAELWRQSISKLAKKEDSREQLFAGDLKRTFDDAMEGAIAPAEPGAATTAQLYVRARKARAEYAEKFERHELTRQLLGTKRGSVDRAVALEDVVRRVMLSPSTSLDQLRQTARIIKRTPQGQQAWRELQGATITHLQERALGNVARDERGTPIFSAAKFDAELSALDRSGKLDYIFGKKNAEKLRTLNEVAKVIFTAPPGTVNTSNTATTLAAMIDLFTASGTGVPVPAVTAFKLIRDRIKDRKLRARVDAQLAGLKQAN